MPLHTSLITAGAGSTIPIAGGAARSGDTGPITTDINLAPIRIGGIFETGTTSKIGAGSNFLPIVAVAGVAVLALFMFSRRR